MPAEISKTVPIEPTEAMQKAGAFALAGDAWPYRLRDVANAWSAMVAAAPALAASASSPEPEEWLPIASAPKDGTRILLAKIVGHPDHPTALWWATLGHWSARWNNWNDGIEPSGLADPTHWLPVSTHGIGPASRHSDGERR